MKLKNALFLIASLSSSHLVFSQCNDGIDNDGDGLVDWQYDLGCYNASDTTEGGVAAGLYKYIVRQSDSYKVVRSDRDHTSMIVS